MNKTAKELQTWFEMHSKNNINRHHHHHQQQQQQQQQEQQQLQLPFRVFQVGN